MLTEKSVVADTLAVVNHHSWAAGGGRQLVISPTNSGSLQQSLLVNFDVSTKTGSRISLRLHTFFL